MPTAPQQRLYGAAGAAVLLATPASAPSGLPPLAFSPFAASAAAAHHGKWRNTHLILPLPARTLRNSAPACSARHQNVANGIGSSITIKQLVKRICNTPIATRQISRKAKRPDEFGHPPDISWWGPCRPPLCRLPPRRNDFILVGPGTRGKVC